MKKKSNSLWSLGEALFLGLSCLVGGEQFYLLLYGTGRSARGQSFVLVITAIITCVLSAAISSRTDVLAHFFHLFYIFMLILQMTISNEITGGIIGTIVTIGLGYALTVLVIQSCSLYSRSREELLSFILGMFSARYLPCFLRIFVSKGCNCDTEIRKLSTSLEISRLVFCIISLVLKVIMGKYQLTMVESFKFKYSVINQKAQCSGGQINTNHNGECKSVETAFISKSFWEESSSQFSKLFKEFKIMDEINLVVSFKAILDHKKYISPKIDFLIDSDEYDEGYFFYILAQLILLAKQFFKRIPIVTSLTSVIIFLMYPKTSFSAYCSYSPKVISTMMNVKFVLHIIGSMVGIGYPITVTSNGALCSAITFFYFCSIIIIYIINLYIDIKFVEKSIYFIATTSFVLGYMWSYNLGLLINMIIKETCVYEEVQEIDTENISFEKITIKMKKSCCGDKITSECYCKLEQVVTFLETKYYGTTFVCSTLTEGDINDDLKRLKYSKDGGRAILLMYNTDDSYCCQDCAQCCSGECNGGCCLKIIGKYKIDAVTVSSCEECQLTIRVEGSLLDPFKCLRCYNTGSQCVCGGGRGKCCLCVKYCNPTCPSPNGCCCIHVCKNNSGCRCQCDTKTKNDDEKMKARLFICYKTNEKKCCIKEIRPNDKADFVGDLKVKNQFDIQEIFISDCCHVDVRIDLRCAVKNNYFRSGANYPRKFEKPEIVRLLWSESMCCPSSKAQCCCMFSQLVKGHVMFKGIDMECGTIEICKITCSCCGSDPKCCIIPCDLIVDDSGGFVKKVDRIRVKLIVISWLFFGLVFFFVVLMASMVRSKYSPVTFYPMISYSKLAGTFATNKYNSNDQVTARIVGLLVNGKITDQTVEAKKVELKAMLRMFAKYSSSQETKKTKKQKPKEVEKIHKYITDKATSFSPSSSIGGRACELCVVEWSQCVGLVYKYAMPLFFFIQKFFIAWENAWKIDFYNYKKQIMPYFTKVTHNSNISLSTVMSGLNVGDKSNEPGLNRLMTWNGGFKETKQLSQGKMEEVNMRNESIPPKIGNRLCYYVRRWNHRLYNIRNWCKYESHLFDWAKFLHEYYKIREWVTDVSPGLRCDSEVKVSTKDLNKGIKIFIATM